MASNSEYEQQNFWKTPDLSLLGDKWGKEAMEKLKERVKKVLDDSTPAVRYMKNLKGEYEPVTKNNQD